MGEVERWWFRTKAAGLQLPDLYCPDDDQNGDFRDGPISLRWAYVHMIEEYARHNGPRGSEAVTGEEDVEGGGSIAGCGRKEVPGARNLLGAGVDSGLAGGAELHDQRCLGRVGDDPNGHQGEDDGDQQQTDDAMCQRRVSLRSMQTPQECVVRSSE